MEIGKERVGTGAREDGMGMLTPEDAKVNVNSELDGSKLAGHDLVAFEVLTLEEATVATHEDLKDEGQTVHVEEPKVPENPTTPRTLPKTGDDTRLGPFVAAMVASGSGLVALGVSACAGVAATTGGMTTPKTATRTSGAAASCRSCPTSARGRG